jgi:hypothetical protein
MLMTKQEMLSLMMRSDRRSIDTDLYSLAALFAERLALVADKLTADEIDAFIDIGAALYSHGKAEFGESVPVEDMFPARDDWQLGPEAERSGFRHE